MNVPQTTFEGVQPNVPSVLGAGFLDFNLTLRSKHPVETIARNPNHPLGHKEYLAGARKPHVGSFARRIVVNQKPAGYRTKVQQTTNTQPEDLVAVDPPAKV